MAEELNGLEYLRAHEIEDKKCDLNRPFAFISYSHDGHDSQIVHNVFKRLYEEGYNLWIDTANMPVSGDSWKMSAINAIRSQFCACALFFRSETSMVKDTIADELDKIKICKHLTRSNIVTIDIWQEPSVTAESFYRALMNDSGTYSEKDIEACEKICDIVKRDNKAIRVAQEGENNIYILADLIARELRQHKITPVNAVSASAPVPAAGPVIATEAPQSQGRRRGRPPKSAQQDPALQPVPASVPRPEPETAPVLEGELPPVTLGEIRRLFLTEEFCLKVQDLRKNKLPHGGKGAIDFGMAAILGGCNNIKQPWQLNYYNFAIADYTKKTGKQTVATWTWSSNCRKLIGMTGAGQIDSERNTYFASLPEDTTIGQIVNEFERAETGAFCTSKNPLVVQCLRMFAALL